MPAVVRMHATTVHTIGYISNLAIMTILTYANCLSPLKGEKNNVFRISRITIGNDGVQHDHSHPTFLSAAV